MEINVAKNAGFCAGVEYAVNKANELLLNSKIYCLGEIVHNAQVIEKLEKNGMKTVQNIDEIPNNSRVIFRAHGVPPEIYDKAREKNLEIFDLTCGNVKNIHNKVEKAKKDAFIIIVGTKNHPETIGTKGFAGNNSFVIEKDEDILDCYMEYEKTSLGKVYVVAQTTFSSQKFDELSEEIEKKFCEAEVVIDKTICNSTENRQLEAKKISVDCDIMLIIGGKNSSNTKKMYEISKENCEKTYFIENITDLETIIFNENCKIGILAGASTPKDIINDVKEFIEMKGKINGSSK